MSEEELLDAMCQAYWKAGPGIRNPMRSILELLHANGYRRCAEGQRVTQWCDRAEEAEAEVERLRKDYHHACATVAQLYAAATGRHGEGPLRGVIEDAAAMCSERDALQAEVERLRADAERYRWLRDVATGDEAVAEIERLQLAYDDQHSVASLMSQEVEKAEAEVERLRADAERYRWLKSVEGWDDASIDAARGES